MVSFLKGARHCSGGVALEEAANYGRCEGKVTFPSPKNYGFQ